MPAKRTKKKDTPRGLVMAITVMVVMLAMLTGGAIGIVAGALRNMPSPEDVEFRPSIATKIYDARGKLITSLFVENRTWVPLADIPKSLQDAIIATEDSRFYRHHGIDLIAIVRAFLADLRHAEIVQGGSTITQQLAKNAFLTHERTFTRKIQEVIYAIQLERRYTKSQILELYLNQIYFGHGAYGVEAAAQTYFGKHAKDLTLPESALLAGIPRGPLYYSPYENMAAARNRRATVLSRMVKLGYITEDEAKSAQAAPIVLAGLRPRQDKAPYFVDYVTQMLIKKYGSDAVYKGGLRVYTTLDLRLQDIATKALLQNLPNGRVDKKGLQQPQGALVALEPSTGYIRAMVGGRGQDEYNRAVMAYRQPGSAFKPFVYTAAIDNGYTPVSLIKDSPVQFVMADGKTWAPQNNDRKFRGSVTLREALADSINVVAVKLLDRIGVDEAIKYAKTMGITSLVESGRPNDRNLNLALGGLVRGITPLEMAKAYAVLANLGVAVEPIAILRVEDANGVVLENNTPQRNIVLDEGTCYVMTNMLTDVIQYGTGKAANIGRPAAGKTGTTSDYTNAWFVGYTPDLVAAVWIGNDIQAEPMIYGGTRIGSARAAQIWGIFMREALKDVPPRDFAVPKGLVFAKVCRASGLLATSNCPNAVTEVFKAGTEPTDYCTLHPGKVTLTVCSDSGLLATPYCPPSSVVQKTYLTSSGAEVRPNGTIVPGSTLPHEKCDIHKREPIIQTIGGEGESWGGSSTDDSGSQP